MIASTLARNFLSFMSLKKSRFSCVTASKPSLFQSCLDFPVVIERRPDFLPFELFQVFRERVPGSLTGRPLVVFDRESIVRAVAPVRTASRDELDFVVFHFSFSPLKVLTPPPPPPLVVVAVSFPALRFLLFFSILRFLFLSAAWDGIFYVVIDVWKNGNI